MEYTYTLEELLMGGGRTDEWGEAPMPPMHIVYKIGIYGWRKRCLYALLLVMVLVVIINIALTVWIIRVMDFTLHGMGSLNIVRSGIVVDGEADFYDRLYATRIHSRTDHSLRLESARNITMISRNKGGHIMNKFIIGNGKLLSQSRIFEIRTVKGHELFYADEMGIRIGASEISVTGKNGTTFRGYIKSPSIKSSTSELRLSSPGGTTYVIAGDSVSMRAPKGNIRLHGRRDIELTARSGKLHLDASRIALHNVTVAPPRFDGQAYPDVYQLCVCKHSGLLFLSPSRGNCQATSDICS